MDEQLIYIHSQLLDYLLKSLDTNSSEITLEKNMDNRGFGED